MRAEENAGGLRTPAVLVIMDGFGLAPSGPGNAISQANTPVLDRLFETCSWTELEASGESVGLPNGQMGNSEVGHLNIGAGRVVFQELTRINKACEDGSLAANDVLSEAFQHACAPGACVHFMGLLSDGGVHSSNAHLYALVRSALAAGVRDVRIHAFLDGRDVPPKSGAGYLAELEDFARSVSSQSATVRLSSVSGRYYAMDRDNRWERVEKAYDAVVCGRPETSLSSAELIERSYEDDVTDEFVVPASLDGRGVQDGDSVVFFNFRPDRARELTRAMTDAAFSGFERTRVPDASFVCLTEYDPEIAAPVAFPKEFPSNVLADVLSKEGLRQYHIAETEKYAHVTFFLNGGIEEPKEGEARVLIASPKVATYDLQPEMSEPEVAKRLSEAIESDEADVYIVNFANCDMVGHTGSIPAAIAAVEAVDEGLGMVLSAVEAKRGFALVTADHGNADRMLAEDGTPFTAHTTAPVPFVLFDKSESGRRLVSEAGALCDIAPTFLELMGISSPSEMTGRSMLAPTC